MTMVDSGNMVEVGMLQKWEAVSKFVSHRLGNGSEHLHIIHE